VCSILQIVLKCGGQGQKKLKAVIRANMDTALSSSDNLPDAFSVRRNLFEKASLQQRGKPF
jgi:hypothetical protein